ncbi:hypothetical protein IMSHALPRED_008710 [Imshaugia aleurites]|uniref:Uncharacterized protein n=1 Tax=Imshaugia aleurites TaxID=172621 RepID=A0A8H3G271_9LECA|nr:hypothetical protein IMSHALPRED_008710 [Imshaugia aleurites]
MEAVDDRLKQLEKIESRLYLEKDATIRSRAQENEQLQLTRQEEDRDFLETLRARDEEEDDLRRKRRVLSRSSLGPLMEKFRYDETQDSTVVDNGPVTRSKTKVKRSANHTVLSSSSTRKNYGLPTAHDSQGRDLFTRPSDGKLVYLHCCVPGCGRTDFPNVMALRNHVSSPKGLHKINGMIISNIQAIEVCGQVAPGQGEPPSTARDQPYGTVAVANTTHADVLPSPPTGSDEYQLQSKASSQSLSDTEARFGAGLSKRLEPSKAQDLDRVYRTRSWNNGSQTDPIRAAKAAEVFNGFLSSDSEESDDESEGSLEDQKTSADRIDQHKAANRTTNPSTRLGAGATSGKTDVKATGGDSALAVVAVDEQVIKQECSTSPTLHPSLLLKQSERLPSPKTLVVAHKRANSAPPITPPAITKRLRISDENLEVLKA